MKQNGSAGKILLLGLYALSLYFVTTFYIGAVLWGGLEPAFPVIAIAAHWGHFAIWATFRERVFFGAKKFLDAVNVLRSILLILLLICLCFVFHKFDIVGIAVVLFGYCILPQIVFLIKEATYTVTLWVVTAVIGASILIGLTIWLHVLI